MSTYYWEEGKKLETSNKNVQMYLYFWNDARTIITNTNLESESFECSSGMTTNVLKLGSVATKEVSFTFHGDFPELSSVLFDVVITGRNRDTDQAFDLPLGQFRVTEDTKSQMTGKRTIKAVDRMNDLINSNADDWLADLDFSTSLKDLTTRLYNYLGETVNSTVTSMVNGDQRIYNTAFNSKYLNGVSTGLKFGDVLEAIGEMTGCFWGIAPMTKYVGDGTWKDQLILLNSSSANDMSYVKGSLEHYEYDTKTVKLKGFTINTWEGLTYSCGSTDSSVSEYYSINNNALMYGGCQDMNTIVSQLFGYFPTAYRTPHIYEMTVPSNPAIKVGDMVTLKDSEDNTIFSSYVTRVTHRGIHAMKTEIGCDIDALHVPDRLTNAEDNILIVNGKVDSTNTNLENNYSTTTEMNTAIGNATSGYLPLTGGDLNGALSVKSEQKVIGGGGEYSVLNSDSLNTYAPNNEYSTLHLQYGGGEVKIGYGSDETDLFVNGEIHSTDNIYVNDVNANGDVDVSNNLSVTGTISESGTSLVDKYANRGETASLEIDGFVCPTINGICNYVDSNNVYHRRIARVDLGSLTWWDSDDGKFFYATDNIGEKQNGWDDIPNGYCSRYTLLNGCSIYGLRVGLGFGCGGINVNWRVFAYDNSYANASAFKSAMQGVYLYYALETEQTEQYLNNYGLVNQVYNGTLHGGRNLFRGYDQMGAYQEIRDSRYNGNYTIGALADGNGAYQSDLVLTQGKTYTVSAMVWSRGGTIHLYSSNSQHNASQDWGSTTVPSQTWTKLVWTGTATQVNHLRIEVQGNQETRISQFMVEEGTTSHDYEPYILSNRQLTDRLPITFYEIDLGNAISWNANGNLSQSFSLALPTLTDIPYVLDVKFDSIWGWNPVPHTITGIKKDSVDVTISVADANIRNNLTISTVKILVAY